MITREDVDMLADGVITVDGFAKEQLLTILEEEFSSEKSLEEIRDALIERMTELAQLYANASGEAAAQWYEYLRDKENVEGNFLAELPELVNSQKMSRSIKWAMSDAFNGNIEATKSKLAYVLSDNVKQASRDTVAHNVDRDPARTAWARVPKGRETCPWCDMLASRGFAYSSAKSAGKRSHKFHDHCDCAIVPSWDVKNVDIAGYDPDALYERYRAAESAVRDKLGSTVNLTDSRVVREMKIQDPERYGYIGQLAGDLPFDKRQPIAISQRTIDHIWDGETSPRKGGHKPGAGRPGKTEFPEHWTKDMVEPALRELYWYGRYTAYPAQGDYRVQGIIDDFLLQGWVHNTTESGGVYPIAGKGITYNDKTTGSRAEPLEEQRMKGVPQLYAD